MFPLQYVLHGKREICLLFKIKMRSDLEIWNFKICARFNGHSAFQFVYRCVIGNLSLMSILHYKYSRIFTWAIVPWTYWLYWVFVCYIYILRIVTHSFQYIMIWYISPEKFNGSVRDRYSYHHDRSTMVKSLKQR